ncbi:LCP family protein [Aeromicrobium chenweiae]|uniref:LytR family transcriptional regulator n=1 Tax=Aeromicrobium chenweiae TaxID=2079793 RepID=A0A2S0WNZ3_9ACTN|nr:LCP family protein [Aeromicrobium chenweiae]AWB93031.1 LytR family transcriptional regulator [Aeromicrobium chenweiae]TGN34021.1 LytR family transcriptional regulator [Aeromicrobium chenweiae]
MSHRASLLGRGYQDQHLDSPRVRFRRALLLCLMTVVLPGSGHLAIGKKIVGWVAVTAWVAAVCGGVWLLVTYRTDRAQVLDWFTDPDILLTARVGLVVVAVLWAALFVDAWRLASPYSLNFARAALITVINVAIIGGVAGSTAYASQVIKVSRETVTTVFPDDVPTSTPLKGRYNILLVGSDARGDREGVRPDSLTVASVDADSGKVVLVSLPRNLQNVPFSKGSPMRQLYPYGYNCGSECLLNAVHTEAQNRPDLYPDSDDPGLDATIDAIEGATDLKVNYFVMVNLNGFKGLVDAVGGVEMDVESPIAMFGHDDAYKQTYIPAGRRTLDGQEALWYARSRVQSDDYTRMGRQKCLMAAMADQLSPTKVLTNATKIAQSGKELLSTNIPRKELGQFADLALKSRGSKIRTVSVVPPEFNTVTPDYDAIHAAIQMAIDTSEGVRKPTGTAPKQPNARKANNSDDLDADC